jgi:four helix bundle protein
MEGKTIKSFQDLIAWQEAHTLVLMTYKETKKYPSDERFGLVNQSRRAAISVSSNIAEGFGRATGKDKHHFYTMAKTSLAELQNQLLAARDLGFITKESFDELYLQCDRVGGLIKGLMRSVSA